MTLSEMTVTLDLMEEIDEEYKKVDEEIYDKLEQMYNENLVDRIRRARKNNNLKNLRDEEIRDLENNGEIIENYDPITQSHYWEWN